MATHVSRSARAVGCLVGGAVGDALGAPVEFFDLNEIRRQYGSRGILALEPNSAGLAHVTDDTQMTMFSGEGLLEMRARERSREQCSAAGRRPVDNTGMRPVLEAYHRWLVTQGSRPETGPGTVYAGMREDAVSAVLSAGKLVHVPRLRARRAPGATCLEALQTGVHTTPDRPRNNSKGCGGVMRVAPVGIIAADPVSAFRLGFQLAALTHGHPSGYITAGVLAFMISMLMDGEDLARTAQQAIAVARNPALHGGCPTAPGDSGEETARALEQAIGLSASGAPATPETVERLGAGWVAEEALAIGLFAALTFPRDFPSAVRLAVNHSGDSDSTGSICGNIAGAIIGAAAIPRLFCQELELRREVRRLAIGLNDARGLTADV
ncbi:MAG: ADP-ribosylglycohydrolase family protein [Spirochaetales bacterium]|nr:ADP-ribosylglycohydrolase family protein [Spirochaetales bacterium]